MGTPRYSRMPFCPSMKPTCDSMIGTPSSPGMSFSMVDLSLVQDTIVMLLLYLSPRVPQGSPASRKSFPLEAANQSGKRSSLRISQATSPAPGLRGSAHLLGKSREVEIITPGRDLATADLKHAGNRQLDLLRPHDEAIDTFVHDHVPGGSGVFDLEIHG